MSEFATLRNVSLAVGLAGAIALSACSAPQPEQPPKLISCGEVINKASFTYTEYDVMRYLWDGQSQQKTVVDYKLATSDGRVVKLNKDEYIAAKIGNKNCENDYGQWNEIKPSLNPSTDCDIVTQAEVLTEGGIAASNLIWDGEFRSKLDYFPLLSTSKFGSIVVGQDKYVLHPVGSEVCFDKNDLTRS